MRVLRFLRQWVWILLCLEVRRHTFLCKYQRFKKTFSLLPCRRVFPTALEYWLLHTLSDKLVRGRAVSSHAMKSERKSRGIAVPILNFGVRITFTRNKNSVVKLKTNSWHCVQFLAFPIAHCAIATRFRRIVLWKCWVSWKFLFTARDFCEVWSVYRLLAKLLEVSGEVLQKSL